MRRKLVSLLGSTAVVLGGGVLLATPAHAANTNVAIQCNSNTVSFSPSSVNLDLNDTVTFTIGAPWAFSVSATGATGPASVSGLNGSSKVYTATGNTGGSLSLTVTTSQAAGCNVNGTGTFTFTGSSSAPSGDSTPVPVVETLSLSVAASGATCTGGNPTGYAGSWLTLPGADKCSQSGPTAKPGAKLLGWATSAGFPIDRAQAQIDKHWGVIDEVINGQRMIFIPGGMATFVSGSNNLFPIWSA